MLNVKHSGRVLHVVGDSRFGGAATIILGLARSAREEGWEADILTTDPTFQEAVRRDGFGVINLDVIRRPIRPLWDIAGLLALLKFLRTERYDLVHTHTSKGGFVGRVAARLAGVPAIIHTVHGFAFHESSRGFVRFAYSTLERLASYFCDRIVAVSHFHREWAVRLRICDPQKIVAIPNGIAEPQMDNAADRDEFRCRLGVREGDLLLLTVSRLAADKGIEYLLEAVAMLPAGNRRLVFTIAGDGPARDKLVRVAAALGVADRVVFLGFRNDVGALLAAADIVVLPSVREGLSISLLEAMAAGKAIVATSIGSQREVAALGDIISLARPGDAGSLKNAIIAVAADPARMSRMAANARTVYELHYTEHRMLSRYRELYSDLLHLSADVRPGIVRQATQRDLPMIVAIHQKAFGRFFLTRLGPEFLRRYYNLVLEYSAGILLVSEGPDGLQGFTCGFLDPAKFYRSLWRARQAFALPVLLAVLRHPSLIGKVISAVRRIQSTGADLPPRSCELSSIAVTPGISGNGVGRALIEAFLARAQALDADSVYLTTDADGNDAVNSFYRNIGFQHTRKFLQGEERWMNEYVINGWEVRNDCRTLV
jgi:glycosyltransferase involved in cell wall biosynthesis/ribosomal protein S18 acetylase RimI-like enzyme